MGYSEALESAGAKVIDYKEVGSYQGDWGAIVEYKGEKGLVTGSYGSCSGCDSFLAEFDFKPTPYERDGKFYYDYEEVSKEVYDEKKSEYDKELAAFGISYLNVIQGEFDVQNKLNNIPDGYWDEERKELLTWALALLKSQ